MLGLKKGTISFIERNEEWDTIAQREIEHLKVLFGPVAKDVQQIGSGAISNPSFRVKFMPILDIAVAVSSFDDVTDMEYKLKAHHIYHVYHKDDNEQLFFECRDMDAGVCTAHIYVVLENSDRWNHFLQFKDYLSINTDRLKKIQYAETRIGGTVCNRSACVPSGKDEVYAKYYGRSYRLFHTGSRDYSGTGRRTTQRRIFARLQ